MLNSKAIAIITFIVTSATASVGQDVRDVRIDTTRNVSLATKSDNSDTSFVRISNSIETSQEVDSFLLEYTLRKNAKRAGMFSALIPGGGQIYNKDYWKLPIVYSLIGTGIGFSIYNSINLRATKKEIAARLSGSSDLNPKYSFLNINQLQQTQDYFKQNFDLSVLLTSLAYLLQIMEAIAANHLKGFDITPDISSNMTPFQSTHHSVGIAIRINKY